MTLLMAPMPRGLACSAQEKRPGPRPSPPLARRGEAIPLGPYSQVPCKSVNFELCVLLWLGESGLRRILSTLDRLIWYSTVAGIPPTVLLSRRHLRLC